MSDPYEIRLDEGLAAAELDAAFRPMFELQCALQPVVDLERSPRPMVDIAGPTQRMLKLETAFCLTSELDQFLASTQRAWLEVSRE